MLDLNQFSSSILSNSGGNVSPTSYGNDVGAGGSGLAKMAFGVDAIAGLAGSYMKGKAAKDAAKYNSMILQAQESIVESNAIIQDAYADLEIRRYRKKADSLLSTQQAMFAKSNVAINSGSPALVMANTIAQSEQDVMIMEMNKRLNRLNTGLQEFSLQQQQRAEKTKGKVAELNSYSEMADSVSKAATTYALKYGK